MLAVADLRSGPEAGDEEVLVPVAVEVGCVGADAPIEVDQTPGRCLFPEGSVPLVDEQRVGLRAGADQEEVGPAVAVEVADCPAPVHLPTGGVPERAVNEGEADLGGDLVEGEAPLSADRAADRRNEHAEDQGRDGPRTDAPAASGLPLAQFPLLRFLKRFLVDRLSSPHSCRSQGFLCPEAVVHGA